MQVDNNRRAGDGTRFAMPDLLQQGFLWKNYRWPAKDVSGFPFLHPFSGLGRPNPKSAP
jgi:hypothetical protein